MKKNIPIEFKAVFLPKLREFRVTVIVSGKLFACERMTISKFIRFARSIDAAPMVIGGKTITASGNESLFQTVRDYFKAVAQAYVAHAWGKTPENN